MKILKRILYVVLALVVLIVVIGVAFAFWPNEWRIKNNGITPEQAAILRDAYSGTHTSFNTSDGETLFLRRWDPDTIETAKKKIAVLIFHGFTAYSGPYDMAGVPISKGGYTTEESRW